MGDPGTGRRCRIARGCDGRCAESRRGRGSGCIEGACGGVLARERSGALPESVAPIAASRLTGVSRTLVYVSASTLPSTEANAVHVMQMCDALAGAGCAVTLRARPGGAGSVAERYGLRNPLRITFESAVTHKLWLLAHSATRGRARHATTLYFGRRLPPLARLASW